MAASSALAPSSAFTSAFVTSTLAREQPRLRERAWLK